MFLDEFRQRISRHASAMYLSEVILLKALLWHGIVGVIYTATAMSLSLFVKNDIRGGDVGLAMTQILRIMVCCQEGTRQMMDLENQFESAKRILDYKHVKLEPPLCTPNKFRPSKDWPQNVEIIFTHFHMRLTPDGNYVLKDLNLKIKSGESIGIMGNGKDFIMLALLRFAVNEGSIEIDDINIETLGLHDLRRAFTVIPSDPLLFSGTIRSNLDPSDEKTDDEIWDALQHVHMKDAIVVLDNGLNTKISDSSCLFSSAETRLICLARAFLCKSKILIFEENDSLVKLETNSDALIEEITARNFSNCTKIKLASDLSKVMDCDKIVVLESGRIIEFGHPYELIQTSRGFFRSLLDGTGHLNAMNLIRIAEKNYILKGKQSN